VQQDFWDGKTLLLQAQEVGAEVAMVFNYRFFDQIQLAQRLIQERNFGDAINVVALTHFATGVLLGTSGINWNFPLFELTVNFEGGRFHFRDLDQDMEVLDYHHSLHQLFSPSRDESRWARYNESFEKSVDAYLASIRKGAPPPVPGIAGLLELQFEASLKKSIAERRPVIPAEEFPTDPVR